MTNDHKNRSTGGLALSRRTLGQAAIAGGVLAAVEGADDDMGAVVDQLFRARTGDVGVRFGVGRQHLDLVAEFGQHRRRDVGAALAGLTGLGQQAGTRQQHADLQRGVLREDRRTAEAGQTAAAAQVCEQRGVPLVMNIAAADKLTEQGYKTVFRNFPTSTMLVSNGMSLMKELFAATGTTPKTAVFLHANDTFGMANKAAIDALFPKLDMPFQIVESISYDPKAQDLAVEVAKAKGTGAELAIVTTRANDAIMMVREMVKQRWEPKGIVSPGSPGLYDEQFYKVLGKYADYAITNLPWYDPKAAMTKRVEAAFKKQFPNDRFEGYAFNVAFTFEAILIAADAFKRAGTAEASAMLAALRQTNLSDKLMVGPAITFDDKGQNTNLISACIQNHKLRPTVVLPKASAEADPVFPMPGWGKRA